MTKILIGVDGSERSEDAVAFGRALALAARAPVILAMAHRLEPLRPGAEEHEAFLRQDAERTLARLAVGLDDVSDVVLRPLVANTSPAHALQTTAQEERAGIIVIGSSHTGRLGRVLPGSTAERLLHGAPCPVAVVPLGYRTQTVRSRPVVGCAYRSTEDGEASLSAAEELALALSASLRVMHVIEPLARLYDSGEMPFDVPEINASIYADPSARLGGRATRRGAARSPARSPRPPAERALMQRVARLNSTLESEGTLHSGRPADVLIGLSETVDILVMGSRGYGPLKALLLGGVSGQVIRSAACPVVVVPRRAASAVGSVFASAARPAGSG
jgi:nucleotide-binding universal stress UspA family protein